MGDAADRATPRQEFAQKCLQEVSYLALAANQRPPDHEVAHILCYRVNRSCATSQRGTFGMVNPDPDACMNWSVYHWFIEMARRSGICPILETIINQSTSELGIKQVEWYGVIIPVPVHLKKDFDDYVQAHLQGKPPPSSNPEPEQQAGPGRPKKKAKLENPDMPKPNTHRASWRRVRDVNDILRTYHRFHGCEDRRRVRRINFDADSEEIEADPGDPDTGDGASTITTLFDIENVLADETIQDQLAETNTPMPTRTAESYMRRDDAGHKYLCIDDSLYQPAKWTIRRISIADRCINPCPETLFDYLLPNNDVPLEVLRQRFSKVDRFNGRKRSCALLTDEETEPLFVGPDAKYSRYAETIDVKVPNPLGVCSGITYSQQWKQRLYPVQSFIEQDCRSARQSAIRGFQTGTMPKQALFDTHNAIAEKVRDELEEETLGTVDSYRQFYNDFVRLYLEIRKDNPVANMARKLLYYDEVASEEASDIPSFDRGLLSLSDSITNHHNTTPQQLSIIMKFLITMFGSARHEFIPVVAMALFGKSDVGKTYCIKKVTSLLPPSMQEAENDSSDKAWVLDGHSPFKFCWMDEIGTGLADGGRTGKSRDSKNMQAGMSNAVASYKQYNRGSQEGGIGDFLKRIDVDCRKTYAITSNKLLNDAMMSRVEPIPTYEDGAHVRGRSKLQKSTCDANSLASEATSLMVQYVMSASVFVWSFHACGGFIKDIDESLFEVFVAMQSAVMGKEQMKCRKVDRLKSQAVSLMVFGCVNELIRKRENDSMIRDFPRLTAFILSRCSVVSLRHVEIAFSLSAPTAKFTEATTRCLIAIKKLIVHDYVSNTPSEDNTNSYYLTDVQKIGASQRLYQSSEMQGNETNLDVLQSALTQLECTANKGLCSVKYDLPGEKLHIIKSAVDDARIMTDVENGIIEWLVRIMRTHEPGRLWRYDYHERHVLFCKAIHHALDDSSGMIQESEEIRALLNDLDFDKNVRRRAFEALKRAKLTEFHNDDSTPEYVVTVTGPHEDPYNGMTIFESDDVHSFSSAPTKEDGPVPGKRKKRLVMAGSVRVNLAFLETHLNATDRADAMVKASEEFSNILHACGGEVKPGERIFRFFSTEIDHEISSARTSRVDYPSKRRVRYKNPRIQAKSDIYDPQFFFDYDWLHTENAVFITAKAGDQIYKRRVMQRVKENTGMDIDEWEAHYQLPPLFSDHNLPEQAQQDNDDDGSDLDEAAAEAVAILEEQLGN